MKLVLASKNKKKLVEMNAILSQLGIEVCSEAEAGVEVDYVAVVDPDSFVDLAGAGLGNGQPPQAHGCGELVGPGRPVEPQGGHGVRHGLLLDVRRQARSICGPPGCAHPPPARSADIVSPRPQTAPGRGQQCARIRVVPLADT